MHFGHFSGTELIAYRGVGLSMVYNVTIVLSYTLLLKNFTDFGLVKTSHVHAA